MKESLSLRFLYHTLPGRAVLKILVQPCVSRAAGRFLSSRFSSRLAPYYIRKHHIDMSGIVVPEKGFSSFNDFFTRKRISDADTEAISEECLISPCDGWLTPVRIHETTVLAIKQSHYHLEDLLKDRELARQFFDGLALVFRLTPADYHRYCYAVNGQIIGRRRLKGILHCVRPIALRDIPVFTQNSREYQVIQSNCFGTVVQMEIGALLVGKITNHSLPLAAASAIVGAEKGYFEFGGSTIVLLLTKEAAKGQEKLLMQAQKEGELRVRRGQMIARSTVPNDPK